MKNILVFFVIAVAVTNSYSQCACCAGAGIGSSNGDYNSGLITLNKNQFIIETYADLRKIKDGNAAEEDEKLLKSLFINSLGIRYRISNKLIISALLPYVTLNTNSGNDKGFGDLIVLGTYKIFEKNDFSFGLQAGLELPTGIQKDSNFDNSTVVVGSGSTDPMLGFVVSKSWKKLTLQGNSMFKKTTNGFMGNYYGNTSIQNISLSYKIKKGSAFCSTEKGNNDTSNFGLSVFSGYYGEWLDQLKEGDDVDIDTGYYLGFANLGTNFSYKKWSLPITFSMPIITKMNGDQNEAGIRFRVGLLKSF